MFEVEHNPSGSAVYTVPQAAGDGDTNQDEEDSQTQHNVARGRKNGNEQDTNKLLT